MRRRIPSSILALATALTLVVAGCGDDGDVPADEATTTTDTIADDGVVDDGITMADATLRFTTEDGTRITTEAAGQLGNVVLTGAEVFDGTGSSADPDSTATGFTIRGQCN